MTLCCPPGRHGIAITLVTQYDIHLVHAIEEQISKCGAWVLPEGIKDGLAPGALAPMDTELGELIQTLPWVGDSHFKPR